jgi:hypothetical protein
MTKSKEINFKANIIDRKAEELSKEMSKHKYIITAEKVNPPLKKMWKIVRMMGFKNAETDKIIDYVRNDLIGKEMHKGDNFHELIKISFTNAITKALEDMKGKKDV